MHPDIEIFLQSLRQTGIPANLNYSLHYPTKIQCNYFSNSDGSIRWIWPAKTRHADFIKFYHPGGLTARLFMFLAFILAKTGTLTCLKHGKFELYTTGQQAIRIKKMWDGRWAWFSGTKGPNRKTILWHRHAGDDAGTFLKIPLSPLAVKNLTKEAEQLRHHRIIDNQNIILPQMKISYNGILELQDISKGTARKNSFKDLPFEAVNAWLNSGLDTQDYSNSAFKVTLDQLFAKLNTISDARIPLELLHKIKVLHSSTAFPIKLLVSDAHGDFTPWNVMYKANKLHLIDLELGQNGMPALFDLFHYVYQSNILIGNKGYKAIRHELDELFVQPQWIQFIAQHQLSTNMAENLYLLYTVSYYLNTYHLQPDWHLQVNWLLDTWNQALTWQLQTQEILPVRNLVLTDLGQLLNKKKYAVLKWLYGQIDSLPEDADIDICINRTDAITLIDELREHPLIKGLKINRKSFMYQVELICLDESMIHMDLIYTFKRKAFVFLNAATLLDNAQLHPCGLKVPTPEEDAEYIRLFYQLNNAPVPERYQSFLKIPFSFPVHTLTVDFQQSRQNKGWRHCLNLMHYLIDTMSGYFAESGFIITFSGVDGAGKSTVIEKVQHLVDKRLRQKVVVIRHRPGLLPIISAWKYGKKHAEAMAATTLPRLGNNQKIWSSLFRFAYYYLDYLIGQWYVQIRYVSRGYIVLYDRYYFDFINDGQRSNIRLSPSFTAWWYKFLIKPKLNFFLYADAQQILQRKQELDANTIQQLTKSYLNYFEKLGKRTVDQLYIPVENLQLSNTLSIVFNQIKRLHHENIY